MINWFSKPTISFPTDPPYHSLICTKAGTVILGELKVDFPVGWRTDLTSTPRWLYWLVPQVGAHNPAVLIHDRLLDLGYDRATARRWLVEQLHLLDDVSTVRRTLIHGGVLLRDAHVAASNLV